MRTHLYPTRMILEYGLPDEGVVHLTPMLPVAAELRRLPTMRRVQSLVPSARGLLIGLQAPPEPSLAEELRSIRQRSPWLPIVVAGPAHEIGVNSTDRESLLRAGVDRVISWRMIGRRDRELLYLWRQLPLLRLAVVVHRTTSQPDPVREIMVRAIAASRPVSSVAQLAALGSLHRATLSRLWSRASGNESTVGAFVGWMQLLHAVVRKDSGRTWRGVAHELGLRHSSIARMGKRVLGHTLSEYDLSARRQLFERFLREMLGVGASQIRRHATVDTPLSANAHRSATRYDYESLELQPPAPALEIRRLELGTFMHTDLWMM